MRAPIPRATPSTMPTTFPVLTPPPPVEDWPRVASVDDGGVITTVRTSPVTVVTLVYTSVGVGLDVGEGVVEVSEDVEEVEVGLEVVWYVYEQNDLDAFQMLRGRRESSKEPRHKQQIFKANKGDG